MFPHAILLSGDNGIGKTTIARVVANELDAELIELDGSTFGKVEIMRDIAENLKYPPMGKHKTKMLIVDECQGLSKAAFDSWLKIVEEPPNFLYFAFCTTEPDKVVKGIKQRCQHFKLKPISQEDLETLILFVAEEEGIELPKHGEILIAKESYGSPRQALVFLSQVRNCKTLEEISDIIKSAIAKDDIVDFCRLLISKKDYGKALEILFRHKDTNIYSLKLQIINYIIGCIQRAKTRNDVDYFIGLLDIFNAVSIDQQFGFSSLLVATSKAYKE